MRKNLYIVVSLIAMVIISYIYMEPMGNGFQQISSSDYTLEQKRVSSQSDPSEFSVRDDKNFYISLGKSGSPKATFTMQRDGKLALYFSINRGSSLANINLNIKKNSGKIMIFTVGHNRLNKLNMQVEQGDTVEIYSSDISMGIDDWLILKIDIQDQLFLVENLLVLLLWILLLVFLYIEGYIYLYVSSYLVFALMVISERLNFGYMVFDTLFAYMILSFALMFVSIALYQLFGKFKRCKMASIVTSISISLLVSIPLSFIIYVVVFQRSLSKDILYALFQTNGDESLEFISSFISLKYILFFVAVVVTIFILQFFQKAGKKKYMNSIIVLPVVGVLMIATYSNFQYLKIPNFILDEMTNYTRELKLFKELKAKRDAGVIEFNATKKEQGETYVVVIGESLNKKHMGLYGYMRDTTPRLSKMAKDGELIVFDSVYSSHVNTVLVLEDSLTQANQYNGKKYYGSTSIIDILKKANVETYWLSNQVIYGAWDNIVSVIGTSAHHVVAINRSIGKDTKTQLLDDHLIGEVRKILQVKSDENRVIFIHLIGNHFSYRKRYPEDRYSYYSGDLNIGKFGLNTYENIYINSYDNSIIFNDFVVTSILKELQSSTDIGAFLYISDHGEDVIGLNGHNSDKFTFDMVEIPMVVWASRGYRQKYKDRYNNLSNHKDTLFSNDMLYDTMVGMFGIDTDMYSPKYDLSSEEYGLNPKDALVLKGKKHYLDADNYTHWQKINAKYLIDMNQSSRVFPHRVNSIGKLKDIWRDGFRSFEVDIIFGDENSSIFRVGHDKETQGVSLDKFISSVDLSKVQRVWLDFKNLQNSNHKEALKRLEYLDKKFHIKDKVILESSTRSKFFTLFAQNGWHTSYSLPTKEIRKLLENIGAKSHQELEDLSVEIAKQITSQRVLALSFDDRLYPFVKKYLEPNISDSVVYHTWYRSALYDINFQYLLRKNQLFRDKRVKTMLVRYISHFVL